MTSKKVSGEIEDEFNVDEKIEEDGEDKNTGFLGPLKRELNKKHNDLKGMLDMNEEECE